MNYTILFIGLGILTIVFSIVAKGFIPYASASGWLLGMTFFLIATVTAFNKFRKS